MRNFMVQVFSRGTIINLWTADDLIKRDTTCIDNLTCIYTSKLDLGLYRT